MFLDFRRSFLFLSPSVTGDSVLLVLCSFFAFLSSFLLSSSSRSFLLFDNILVIIITTPFLPRPPAGLHHSGDLPVGRIITGPFADLEESSQPPTFFFLPSQLAGPRRLPVWPTSALAFLFLLSRRVHPVFIGLARCPSPIDIVVPGLVGSCITPPRRIGFLSIRPVIRQSLFVTPSTGLCSIAH